MKLKNRKTQRPKRAANKPSRAATIQDILPVGVPAAGKQKTTGVPRKWASNYRNLLGLRLKLLQQMGQLAEQAHEFTSSKFGMHMADAGTDSFDRDFALSLLSSDQNALYEVEEALKRIENDAYGVCEMTGKPIPKARLDAIPWTRFSVQAQSQLEKEGALRRARFADLGSIEEQTLATTESDEEQEEKTSGE